MRRRHRVLLRGLGHVEVEATASDLGRTLAGMAHLEAAAVLAFEQLARQLEAHGGPAELVARCLGAAADERAHARWLTAATRRHGAAVPTATAEPARDDLVAIAMNNAVEGCAHETLAALAARVRADRASDPVLRAVFARIADDEARHAQLAWDLHGWFLDRLDEDGRSAVRDALADALDGLPALARTQGRWPADLGQPDPSEASELAEALAA